MPTTQESFKSFGKAHEMAESTGNWAPRALSMEGIHWCVVDLGLAAPTLPLRTCSLSVRKLNHYTQ